MKPHPALRPSVPVRLFAFVVALCLPVLVAAPLPQTSWLATVGTSWRQPSGQDWSYLLYQSSDGTALAGRTVAVYRKDGEPNSPATFTRQAVTRLQDNPAVIAPLLDRSVNVGEDLNELAEHVTGLFQSLIPAPAVSLPERLAAVVQGLNADPSLHSRVLLLSRRHPGAALAFGMAWTEPLPTGIPAFTYELRDHDPVSGTDRAVIARVTIRPGAALVLPAPGIAVDVPTNSPQADLLARLRWSTPDPLRRLAPAQMGFNVYRIPTPVATTLGFTTNPPAAGVLATLARQAAGVERVNEQPVVPPKEYGATDVADFALDPTTVFITDNRARFRGGPGFVDGDRFCYFVAARDILGRDGQYSPALCVTLCDRVPPSAPRSVKIANDYLIEGTAGVQRLKVQWQPADGATTQKVARYAIFRWDDLAAMHEWKPDLAIGTTPIVQAAKELSIPALYFTNLISARPLMGPAGAGSLATVINAAIGNKARFDQMREFFGGTGVGHTAGVWENAAGVPQDRPEFKAETRRLLEKQAKKRKAEAMV